MSSQHTDCKKPRSLKCHHYFLYFDLHNYCPTCRESGKGDDPCVTNNSVCTICNSFTEKQRNNIHNRSRYVRKQKTVADTSKDEADLLGDFCWVCKLALRVQQITYSHLLHVHNPYVFKPYLEKFHKLAFQHQAPFIKIKLKAN